MDPSVNGDFATNVLDWIRNRYFGKYRGTVVNTDDPTSRGRLEVRVPSVLGDQTAWAMPCVPFAGDGVGFYALPPVDAGVWVEFEGGDPSYPIWAGCFWEDGQLPDESSQAIKVWKTDSVTIRIDDDAQEIMIETDRGARLTLTADIENETSLSTLSIGRQGVVSESGAAKTEVAGASFKVNNGSFEVM